MALFNTFECTSRHAYRFDYFQGVNLDTDASVHKGDMIVQESDLNIKLRESMARLGLQDRLYVAARPAGEFTKHKCRASNKQHLPLIMPLAVCFISPLFVKSKTISCLS